MQGEWPDFEGATAPKEQAGRNDFRLVFVGFKRMYRNSSRANGPHPYQPWATPKETGTIAQEG